MKKIIPILVVIFALFTATSCNNVYFETENVSVCNKGTVTSSEVSGRTTITIDFGTSGTGTSYDESRKVVIETKDTGRYETLVDVYAAYGLVDNKLYACSIPGTSVKYLVKNGDVFKLSNYKSEVFNVGKDSISSDLNKPFSISISYGGETLINYPNLPLSPVGLPEGTLWNDHGTIKIV